MKAKLTATSVRTLPFKPGNLETSYVDTQIPDFTLRVREGGSRALYFCYRRQGAGHRSPKIKIGNVEAVDFATARKTAKQYYARVQMGEDPAQDKADDKAKASETFGAVA